MSPTIAPHRIYKPREKATTSVKTDDATASPRLREGRSCRAGVSHTSVNTASSRRIQRCCDVTIFPCHYLSYVTILRKSACNSDPWLCLNLPPPHTEAHLYPLGSPSSPRVPPTHATSGRSGGRAEEEKAAYVREEKEGERTIRGRKRKRETQEQQHAMASGGDARVDLLPLDALRRYLQLACAPLFGEADAAFASPELADPAASAVLEQFIADSAARLLQVNYFPPDTTRMDVDSENSTTTTTRLRVNLGIEYAAGKARGHDAVCFIKRLSAPLTSDVALNHQLQVMTLALGKKRAEAAAAAATSSSSGESTEEEDDDHSNLLSVVYNYVHQSFGPLVNEYSKVHQPQHEVATSMSDGARGALHCRGVSLQNEVVEC